VSVHDLQAPKEDGAVLAHPPLAQTERLLGENKKRLSAISLNILGRPFQTLRALARSNVLEAAQNYLAASGEAVPPAQGKTIVLAGHQPELFHPGVWIKNFALNGLARSLGAIPLNLVVDNDTAKNSVLHLPAEDHIAAVPYDQRQSEVPFEERAVLDESLFRDMPQAAAKIMGGWNFAALLPDFWAEVCRHGQRTPLLGERFAAARRVFERRWQCANWEVPLSLVCGTEGFAWFALHILDNLPAFHDIYNTVVDEYRRRYHMRSRNHPVPNLAKEGDWFETPFWAWRSGQKRRERLFVRRTAEELSLRAGTESWPSLRFGTRSDDLVAQWQALAGDGYKIRTRALTTTLFARLFLGDIFLHGLGGGKYDELTDEIMRQFYDIEPPSFLILTGTLLLPFSRMPVSKDDRCRLHALERDLWWNPQRHLENKALKSLELGDEKNRWIARVAVNASERRTRYETLRKLTGELRPFVQDEEKQTRLKLERTAHDLRIQQICTRRDYAFCLYPEDRLWAFCGQFL
jgi:hypothetical protein